MERYFVYGQEEVSYLKRRDKRLSEVIDRVGMVKREVIPDLFAALVNSIVGQQISTKVHKVIWQRIVESLGEITPKKVLSLSREELRAFGISYRKVDYILSVAEEIASGEFDIQSLKDMDDAALAKKLTELKGIGLWSAEMLMLFSMERQNIFSYGDLGIRRGLEILYHHRKINDRLFEKYRRRFSPYCSVASLYLWEVAAGVLRT